MKGEYIEVFKNFVQKYYLHLVVFYGKHREGLLIIVTPLGGFLLSWFVIFALQSINPAYVLAFLLYASFTLLLLYFLYPTFSTKLTHHQGVISFFAVIISLVTFLWQNNVNMQQRIYQAEKEFFSQEVALKEENNRNFSHLESIINDISTDQDTVFWRDFSVKSYETYWHHIQFTKSQECKNLYAALVMQLGALNNINATRRSEIFNQVVFNSTLLNGAQGTLPILREIVGKCQVI